MKCLRLTELLLLSTAKAGLNQFSALPHAQQVKFAEGLQLLRSTIAGLVQSGKAEVRLCFNSSLLVLVLVECTEIRNDCVCVCGVCLYIYMYVCVCVCVCVCVYFHLLPSVVREATHKIGTFTNSLMGLQQPVVKCYIFWN